ncbi:sensor histidine kinase [Paractinoplanes globisporus]|uniref:histidine kinase n=1 Tax=Paractinoplanes globisporus TaxID=113565 RepID=A0ABW6W7H6_9ACTN|nr:histidine kinase [Actinoplanes globisporus]
MKARAIPLVLGPLVGLLAVAEANLDAEFAQRAAAIYGPGLLLGAGVTLATWFPLAGTLAAAACFPLGLLLGAPDIGGAGLIGLIGVVAWSAWRLPPRRALLALVTAMAAGVVTSLLAGQTVWEAIFQPAILLPGWLLGRLSRINGERAAELTRLAAALDAERERSEHAAIIDERTRIAREVHDAVAHSVSVMTLQLGGLRRQLDDPVHREIAGSLERLGRQSVEEMRGLVGILRDSGTAGLPVPEPSLARATELVADVAAAGLPVDLVVDGERAEIPRLLDASAYRVLQEALTNVLRHSGLVPTRVTIGYAPERVTVEVVNEKGTAEPGKTGGHGLVGMRERVSLFRGTISAGPQPDGGFAVRASFPMGQTV